MPGNTSVKSMFIEIITILSLDTLQTLKNNTISYTNKYKLNKVILNHLFYELYLIFCNTLNEQSFNV